LSAGYLKFCSNSGRNNTVRHCAGKINSQAIDRHAAHGVIGLLNFAGEKYHGCAGNVPPLVND
jgi:hypothetical protein